MSSTVLHAGRDWAEAARVPQSATPNAIRALGMRRAGKIDEFFQQGDAGLREITVFGFMVSELVEWLT